MNHYVKTVGLTLIFSMAAHGATKKMKENYKEYIVPTITEVSFEDARYEQAKKDWNKQHRKIASQSSFSLSDMSADWKDIRDQWLLVKTGDEMEALLKKSYGQYNSYSPDSKYFLAQMHVALPLRGIIWRLVPLFENNKGFLGNTATHVTAIQAVRGAVTALKMLLPTKQTDAGIQYFTEPSVEMTKADQFTSIPQFQRFLVEKLVPALNDAASKIASLKTDDKMYVWDNKMMFGQGTFEDEVRRFVGNGPAEINFVLATLYRAQHNILVYCAYNQDYSIRLVGEMGSHFGLDASIFGKKSDVGITDQERVGLARKAANSHHFLELRNYGDTKYGSQLMKSAYVALKNSVVHFSRSYGFLQNRDSNTAFAINPILFQPEVSTNLDKAIENMKALVKGPAEVRDPVSGETVTINVPAFYNEPPASLKIFMATQFEGGDSSKVITNKKGEVLKVRNYLRGRSIAWDNESWKKYVPSAEGKNPGYMAEAKRVIQYSFGSSIIFGLPDLFVH